MNVLLWASASPPSMCWTRWSSVYWNRIGYSWWMYFGLLCCFLLLCDWPALVPRGVCSWWWLFRDSGWRAPVGWYSCLLSSMPRVHFFLRQHILSGRVFLTGPPHKYFMTLGCRTACLPAFLSDWLAWCLFMKGSTGFFFPSVFKNYF